MKTLLDLFNHASDAAKAVVGAATEIERMQAKLDGLESVNEADHGHWLDFFEGELQRFRTLATQLTPSAKAAAALAPTAPAAPAADS